MATKFSGDVGYRGVVKIGSTDGTAGAADLVILLATSGQFSFEHNPIFSSGVWGAGYKNAAENVAYANNYMGVTGSFGFELTKGSGLSALNNFAFTNRGSEDGTQIVILPNGEQGFQGYSWCTSLSLNASTDSIVTGDCNFTSYIRDADSVTTGINSNSPLGSSGGVLPMNFNDLYPYWATKAYITWDAAANDGLVLAGEDTDGYLKDLVEWSASYSSDIQVLKCCDGQPDNDADYGKAYEDGQEAPLAPDYIMLGAMSGECSFTIFRLKDGFNPEIYHAARGASFRMAPSSALTVFDQFNIAKMVVNTGGTQIQTGSTYVQANYDFTAIGDGANAPVQLVANNT